MTKTSKHKKTDNNLGNITPNKKGKNTIANKPGLTS